jgi:hypothetical protein
LFLDISHYSQLNYRNKEDGLPATAGKSASKQKPHPKNSSGKTTIESLKSNHPITFVKIY